MKQGFVGMISRLLIVALLLLPFQSIQAGMVTTEQVSAATSAQASRDIVLSTISRAEVASQMQAMGIDSNAAQARVGAMTDAEVSSLANQIGSLPAGASNNNGWAIAAGVLVIGLIWYFYFR